MCLTYWTVDAVRQRREQRLDHRRRASVGCAAMHVLAAGVVASPSRRAR